jgi:hypothetical protein
MKKPAKKKRGGHKPPPAIVLRATPSSTNPVVIKKILSGPQGGKPAFECTQEIADEICHRIAHGSSLRQLTLADDMPSHPVIRRWRDEHVWFSQQYARAVEDRNDYWAAEALDIANTPMLGVKTERSGVKGVIIVKEVEGDMLEHRRLQVDTRKWLLSKLDRRFKEKVDVNHGGQPDGVPIPTAAIQLPADPVEAARVYQRIIMGKKE